MMDTQSETPTALAIEESTLPGTTALCQVHRVRDNTASADEDQLIEEVPVALVFNGISHAVMLASPSDLGDFAIGFSLSEGIVEQAREIHDLEVQQECNGLVVKLEISSQRFFALKDRRRSLAGRTGCGLCGLESLDAVAAQSASNTPLSGQFRLSNEAIDEALRQLPHRQPLRHLTGASHGAAWCDAAGNIKLIREDVGRHNALDKLVGALARQTTPTHDGFALITSRASYEMVQKAAHAGITAMVAVSAPTAMATRMADSVGMLLIGFARSGQRVVYSQANRLDLQPSSAHQSLL
jgi:FdhD protein